MNDGKLFYVYQADGYNHHHPTVIRADSEADAIERHKDYWREMFDKPADAEPHDGTYAKPLEADDLETGGLREL